MLPRVLFHVQGHDHESVLELLKKAESLTESSVGKYPKRLVLRAVTYNNLALYFKKLRYQFQQTSSAVLLLSLQLYFSFQLSDAQAWKV